MNYKKVYYAIINKALRKERTGQRWKGDGNYYEKHHIVPRSLGGLDLDNNLVLLTAKEHYLCHWLLFKSYELNTVERKKMLKAWFMMAAVGDTNRPSINMNDYNRYRNELAKTISDMQTGENNSQYGAHWYTDLETGETIKAKFPPYKHYVLGKNWFASNKNKVYNINTSFLKFKQYKKYRRGYIEYIDDDTYYKMDVIERRKYVDNCKKEQTFIKNQKLCQKLWDEYHSCNYETFKDFILKEHPELNYNSISDWLKKYIPYYKNIILNGNYKLHKFKSNPNLIGIYE